MLNVMKTGSNANSFGTFLETVQKNEQVLRLVQGQVLPQTSQSAKVNQLKLVEILAESGSQEVTDLMEQSGLELGDFLATLANLISMGLVASVTSDGSKRFELTPEGSNLVQLVF
jgi:predicted transcriptional regulator